VVGVDPGVTTGLCAYLDGEYADGEEATKYDQIAEYISRWQPHTVVVENFVLRRGRAAEYHAPIRTIGVIEYICGQRGIPMVLQQPSVLGLTRSRAQGLHRSEHVRSACAHVVYSLARRERGKCGESRTKQARKSTSDVEEGPSVPPSI
jgi:hypothetical protein